MKATILPLFSNREQTDSVERHKKTLTSLSLLLFVIMLSSVLAQWTTLYLLNIMMLCYYVKIAKVVILLTMILWTFF